MLELNCDTVLASSTLADSSCRFALISANWPGQFFLMGDHVLKLCKQYFACVPTLPQSHPVTALYLAVRDHALIDSPAPVSSPLDWAGIVSPNCTCGSRHQLCH